MDKLPLVLAGPIVRHSTPDEVTVWVALLKKGRASLRVYGTDASGKQVQLLAGTRVAVAVGDNLHLVAVTARGTAKLEWGKLYRYNLFFDQGADEATPVPEGAGLFAPGVIHSDPVKARNALCYGTAAGRLPSFVLPPARLSEVRLLHGSCRKPHGGGDDGLATADLIIATAGDDPRKRPHQLFLTGDQIYADDVADALLTVATDAGDTLLGWTETLPGAGMRPAGLLPGMRAQVAANAAGLSSDAAKSHLFGLGEFCAMFLLAWSNVLWPEQLATYADLKARAASYPVKKSVIEEELRALDVFRKALPAVRRALANVTTYMNFDDHEISDDWYLHLDWCDSVLRTELGPRLIANGLTAFALFQMWGNTPRDFEAGKPGGELLKAVARWRGAPGADAQAIAALVGVPNRNDVLRDKRLTHTPGSLDWHFRVVAPQYEVIVLDTRTWRSFPEGREDPPALIFAADALDKQLGTTPPPPEVQITLVVSSAPFLGVMWIENLIRGHLKSSGDPAANDFEAWGYYPPAFEQLLARLLARPAPGKDQVRRARVAILSGDVHYGFAGRIRFSARAPYKASAPSRIEGVLAQLTSSALKNEEVKPLAVHVAGYPNVAAGFMGWQPAHFPGRLPRFRRAGWTNAAKKPRTVGQAVVSVPPLSVPIQLSLRDSPSLLGYTDRSFEYHDFWTSVLSFALDANADPEWQYEVAYYGSESTPERTTKLDFVGTPDGGSALTTAYIPVARDLATYRDILGAGMEIVGRSNLGEVMFDWGEGDSKRIVQRLWWRIPPEATFSTRTARPLTQYVVPLPLTTPVMPGAAPLEGGTRVKVLGRNLSAPPTVTIGGRAAREVEVAPDGAAVYVTVPAAPAGPADVIVNPAAGPAQAYRGALVYTGDLEAATAATCDAFALVLDEVRERATALSRAGTLTAEARARLALRIEIAQKAAADILDRRVASVGATDGESRVGTIWLQRQAALRAAIEGSMAALAGAPPVA
ncbi:MAG: hypothetical protein M3540_10515 [Actinomycetota bacterium]|nr:hypothetical protein [Actinomycetota bacterium]